MPGPFKQNCADCRYNSNPSCHPENGLPAQKKVMEAAYARRKEHLITKRHGEHTLPTYDRGSMTIDHIITSPRIVTT
eukprot:8930280-Ditylum_brightwellii.AAC.1